MGDPRPSTNPASLWNRVIGGEPPVGPRLARADDPHGFVEAVGERMALFGAEDGRMEVWMWPLLLLHDLELRVRRSEGGAVSLGPRSVEVVPEGLGLAWSLAGAASRRSAPQLFLDAFCASDERALVLLLRHDADESLDVELEFTPAFRPMWPAGLGGQITGRDDETGAFYATEEIGRFAMLFGGPEARLDVPAGAEPGQRGVRGRSLLRARITPERATAGPLALVCAGAELAPRSLTDAERRGGNQAATGASRAREAVEAARALWRRMHDGGARDGWESELARQRRHWRGFLARTASLESGDAALDEAFLWSKIAIERAWVRVDGVGRGLVAGLGPGRGTERPGFAWLFNGDALEACRALALLGDREGCRNILRFACGTQRDDGKITHEITLSAALCDWLGDFPYAYYKGNQTPELVAAFGRYVRWSRDLELARELWPSIERAVDWCLSVCDERLVMQVPAAGIAAVEAGPLAGRIRAEAFLQASFEDAVRELVHLERCTEVRWPARWATLREFVAEDRFGRAFESADGARVDFAALDDGSRHPGPSAYSMAILARGTPERALLESEVLRHNHPRLMADWGARMFAMDSEHYAPEHYNTGSVFPFLTQHQCIAAFRSGLPGVGWQILRSQVELMHFGGLGVMPEFLPGDRARMLPHVVPHQVFSHAALLECILDGWLGLDCDAATGEVTARPSPDTPIRRCVLERLRGELGARLELDIPAEMARGSRSGRFRLELASSLVRGAPSRQARLIGYEASDDVITYTIAGPAGARARIGTLEPGAGLTGPAELERVGDDLYVTFPAGAGFTIAAFGVGPTLSGTTPTARS